MDDLWRWLAILLSPVAGSFIGLVSLRLPAGRGVVAGRSACEGCGRTLNPLDLVPIVSFLALRGRCRTCGTAIPRRYLVIELAALALGAWAAFAHTGPLASISAAFAWTLLLIAVVDYEHQWLPDAFTLPLAAAGLLLAILWPGRSFPAAAIGLAAGFLALWLVAFAYRRIRGREGLGDGDPRLFGALGAWVGWMGLPSVLVWACAVGLIALIGLAARGIDVRADRRIPFGTLLAIGGWLVWLYGPIGL